MRCSQDGEWEMRWNSTERLTLKNKMMNSKRRLQCTMSQSAVYFTSLSELRAAKYMQILSRLYLEVVSFPQCVVGQPLFCRYFLLFFLLERGDWDFLY